MPNAEGGPWPGDLTLIRERSLRGRTVWEVRASEQPPETWRAEGAGFPVGMTGLEQTRLRALLLPPRPARPKLAAPLLSSQLKPKGPKPAPQWTDTHKPPQPPLADWVGKVKGTKASGAGSSSPHASASQPPATGAGSSDPIAPDPRDVMLQAQKAQLEEMHTKLAWFAEQMERAGLMPPGAGPAP